ncbi:EAL and modified HD-GYP domain-containing signal transduction protein [Jatrophihabitans sp. GAS493]|uniref:EAL and HDOD domain-containing protein n=1 Tax=Jatrophihabitans sp. GAS493 TaxID=1907575 RepID=UPI000BB7FE2E|nr:HDOD domain-containing protein [Jatrophihabitans sp. GAS493]SOD71133.1 EAL and modified HD-GYP domain-containing signal transduction protein [Jatrophihabitans sp. GAS493]
MSSATSDVVVGRQSIHGRDSKIVAYELQFLSVDEASEQTGFSGEEMTDTVLFGAISIGLKRLIDGKMLFCSVPRAVLIGDIPLTLPPRITVLQLDKSVASDPEAIAGCRRLIDAGFQLAMDDFEWTTLSPELLPMLSVVKVDVHDVPVNRLVQALERYDPYQMRLVAKNIHTEQEWETAHSLGFELFQGQYLHRPVAVAGRKLEPSNLARLKMAATVLSRTLDFEELEDVLRREPGLTYQILQLASIGRVGETGRKIHSIREALIMAGSYRIQNWLSLLLARSTGQSSGDAMVATLTRARACELLAATLKTPDAKSAFAAGMLSGFDALLQMPSSEVIRTLPLAPELQEAAFGTKTPLARVIRDVIAYEDLPTGTPFSAGPAITSDATASQIATALAQGFSWAIEANESISAA